MSDGPHQRRCWECGNVAEHKDSITPWVLCSKCGSQDTRRVKAVEDPPTIADLGMLLARLVQQVRKHDPQNDVADKAMDYLRRKDLAGSILR